MKFCLKLILVMVLTLQLIGVGVGTYYVVPKDLPFKPLITDVKLDQRQGTYVVHYHEDSGYWNKVFGFGVAAGLVFDSQNEVYNKLDSHPFPAEKKFKLAFHQKTFQKSEGVTPETLAAVIISIDRGRYHNSIVRIVSNIQRARIAEQAISSLNRIRHVNDWALATMPVGYGPEQVALHYFRLESGLFSPEQLAMEYARRELIPDPQAQIADNEQDPSLAHDYPNATQWRLSNDTSYSLTFDENSVGCDHCTAWVGDDWWFAGVRRS